MRPCCFLMALKLCHSNTCVKGVASERPSLELQCGLSHISQTLRRKTHTFTHTHTQSHTQISSLKQVLTPHTHTDFRFHALSLSLVYVCSHTETRMHPQTHMYTHTHTHTHTPYEIMIFDLLSSWSATAFPAPAHLPAAKLFLCRALQAWLSLG